MTALVLGVMFTTVVQGQDGAKRVLVLYPYDNALPATTLAGDATRKRLLEQAPQTQIHTDFLDLVRFPDDVHGRRTAEFLREKYAQTPLDMVVVLNTESLRFAIKHRDVFAPNLPIVFCCVIRAVLNTIQLPGDVTGIVSEFDITKTVELARRLQPGARNVVYIGGSSEIDRRWAESYRAQLRPLESQYNVTYLLGLSREELLERVAQLSSDSIVFLGPVFADSSGRQYVPVEIGQEIAQASNAPTYANADPYLGRGIVGGHMGSFEAAGSEVADLALEILNGADPRAIAPRTSQSIQHRVDARQLQRWGLSEKNLPEGAIVYFRQPTLWEEHRDLVIATSAIILLQAALITALLLQIFRRKRVEASLKDSEERWRSIFETSTVGIALADHNMKYLVANEAFHTMLGYAGDELRGLSPFDTAAESDLPSCRKSRKELKEGQKRHHEMIKQCRRKDGSLIWVHEHVSTVPGPDNMPGLFLETAIDITDRKRAEHAIQVAQSELARVTRLTTMGEMTASIAHEVNQPLAAIVTSSNAGLRWLANPTPNLEEAQAAFKRVVKEGHRAAEVIATVRAMFKKESRSRTRVDLSQLVREVLAVVQGELQGHQISVRTSLAESLPLVHADRVQLQQVILNLIINAIEAMAAVADRARILRITSELRRPAEILLTIEDSGPGIAIEEVARVFEAFYTTKPDGMGMGLSICRSIIESHGGRLAVSRGHPHGAVFQVFLPINPRD